VLLTHKIDLLINQSKKLLRHWSPTGQTIKQYMKTNLKEHGLLIFYQWCHTKMKLWFLVRH